MDIEFAIDELYSAGWWPRDADACVRAADGRWYPDDHTAHAAFTDAGWTVRYHAPRPAGPVRVAWNAPSGLRGAAIAPDPVSARILAFTALFRGRPSTPASG